MPSGPVPFKSVRTFGASLLYHLVYGFLSFATSQVWNMPCQCQIYVILEYEVNPLISIDWGPFNQPNQPCGVHKILSKLVVCLPKQMMLHHNKTTDFPAMALVDLGACGVRSPRILDRASSFGGGECDPVCCQRPQQKLGRIGKFLVGQLGSLTLWFLHIGGLFNSHW